MTTTLQDRRTAAALAFAEAAWTARKAEMAANRAKLATRSQSTLKPALEASYEANAAMIRAEQDWFAVAEAFDARPMPAEAG